MKGTVTEVVTKIVDGVRKTLLIVTYKDSRWPSADATIAFETSMNQRYPDDTALNDEVELSITKRQNKSESLKNRP